MDILWAHTGAIVCIMLNLERLLNTHQADRYLYNADLSVGHADQSAIDQLVSVWVPRLPLHDLALRLLVGQGNGGDLQERDRL